MRLRLPSLLAAVLLGASASAQVFLADADGTVALQSDRYFGLWFTTPSDDPGYLMTGFSFLGDADLGANPVGAGTLYVFSSSPHNAVTPAGLSGYSTGLLGTSAVWNGTEYSFGAGLALDPGTTYWVLSDTSGFEVGCDFASPNNAVYATSSGNTYFNQLQTINYQVLGTAVPEPATMGLFLGLAAAALVLGRRKRSV